MQTKTSLKEFIRAAEIEQITKAMNHCQGNITHAGQMLGVKRNTLSLKLRRFELAHLIAPLSGRGGKELTSENSLKTAETQDSKDPVDG